jgi:hypothetical protein
MLLHSNGAELAMNSRTVDPFDQIDHATCRSICKAIGERLQQNMRADTSTLSPHLRDLMDQLRERDNENLTQN